jgi:hypothetical protein
MTCSQCRAHNDRLQEHDQPTYAEFPAFAIISPADDYIEILETMEKASGRRMAQKVDQAVKFAHQGQIVQLGKKSFADKVLTSQAPFVVYFHPDMKAKGSKCILCMKVCASSACAVRHPLHVQYGILYS